MCYKYFRSQINWVTCVGTKMEPYVISETKYLRINSGFTTAVKAWLPSLAFSFLPGILLALCHCSGAALMDRAVEIKGLSGWKGKLNKTAWWEGCRWLLKVLQQNEQQFILEQPVEAWLNWGALIVLTLLNPFSFKCKCNFKKGCLKWKVRSFIIRKCPYETFWIFMWSISAFLSDT